MAEVYEEFSGSSTQDVVCAADGHSMDIKRKVRVKRTWKERPALYI
jgi:hypothetical protein